MGINGYLFGQHATIIPRAKSLFLPTPGFSVPSDGVPFSNSCGFPVYSTGGKRLRLSTGVHPVPGRCNQGGGCYEVRGSALDVAMEIEGGKQRIKGLV